MSKDWSRSEAPILHNKTTFPIASQAWITHLMWIICSSFCCLFLWLLGSEREANACTLSHPESLVHITYYTSDVCTESIHVVWPCIYILIALFSWWTVRLMIHPTVFWPGKAAVCAVLIWYSACHSQAPSWHDIIADTLSRVVSGAAFGFLDLSVDKSWLPEQWREWL